MVCGATWLLAAVVHAKSDTKDRCGESMLPGVNGCLAACQL